MPSHRNARTKHRAPRTRRQPAVRRQELCDAAARLIVRQGYLPLSIERLAQESGVSKALFYTYFPDQYALFNHLLHRELTGLFAGGLDLAAQIRDLDQAILLCGTLYFEHVARAGLLLHILFADRYMTGYVERRLLRLRNSILLRLMHATQSATALSKSELRAAIEMMIAIPEEAGRLVFTRELELNVGRQLCRTLLASAIHALRAPNAVLAGLVRPHHVA